MLVEHAHAARVAEAAGRLLVELRSHADLTDTELRDAGDRRSHELLLSLLTEAFPDDAILSEEGKDDAARLEADRVWIVDPLDGTREYGEQGR